MAMSTSVIVFAKAPVAGFAKTRLAPALGVEAAALLAERMLCHALAQAVAAGIGPVELCVTPDASHPALRRAAADWGATLAGQGPGDLGERMHRALARHLAQPGRALLMGSDAPALDAARLRQAAAALADHDAVFVPALDGGYVLIGLRRPDRRCFDGMSWSHSRVMHDTRARLRAAGARWAELEPLADIDEPADLRQLPSGWLEAVMPLDPAPGPAAGPPRGTAAQRWRSSENTTTSNPASTSPPPPAATQPGRSPTISTARAKAVTGSASASVTPVAADTCSRPWLKSR